VVVFASSTDEYLLSPHSGNWPSKAHCLALTLYLKGSNSRLKKGSPPLQGSTGILATKGICMSAQEFPIAVRPVFGENFKPGELRHAQHLSSLNMIVFAL
jgi:hypothetical protein